MSTTFDSMVENTPIWLYATNRKIVEEMPKLISDAEDQIYLRFDHDLFQTVLPSKVLPKGQTDIDLESDEILEIRAVRLKYRGQPDQYTPLERRGLEFLTMLYSTNRPGRPRFYAEYGSIDNIRLFPTPNTELDVEITVNVDPPRLSEAVQENIITKKYPRVIERAVLRQGSIFMRNDIDEARYGKETEDALLEANMAIARRRRDETATRPIETANTRGA